MNRLLGAALISLLVVMGAQVVTPGTASAGDPFRVAFSSDVFVSVNKNDALASIKAWIRTLGLRRGVGLDVEVMNYDGVADLRELVRDHGADLFITNSIHYVELEPDQLGWDPLFVPQQGEFVLEEYVLLVRSDRSGDLASLQNGSVLVLRTTGAKMAREWLDFHLRGQGLGAADEFFDSVTEAVKPSTAVLPVFFGQVDACVVDRSSFDLMTELNPQIGTNLVAVAESAPYLESVLCLHRDYRQHRAEVVDGMSNLHDESAGQQMMLVFKIDRLVPFASELLETVRALHSSGGPPMKAAAQ